MKPSDANLTIVDQEKLLELEIDAIIRSSQSNIVVADADGIVLRASPSCLEIYGKRADELIGKSVFELERLGIFFPSVTAKVLREKKDFQTMQYTKTGRVVMATGIPVFDEKKRIVRVISFSHDLTEIEQLKQQYEQLKAQMERYESEIEELREKETHVEGIVMASKRMKTIWQLIQRVAKANATILLTGESGVGKSLYAKIIHTLSERKKGPFIEVNCGAIPESLFESELFGYEAGAFTGADKRGKVGIIEAADKGTLFLDEIGEIPLAMQAKLLKVIQEKKTQRIGSVKGKAVDFRLIAATNQNLEEMVKQGRFRKDLYFRLHVIPIEIPPLRERVEDIILLAQYYLNLMNEKYACRKTLDPRTLDVLTQYHWPGNVRELENLIERLVLTVEDPVLRPEHLPYYLQKEKTADFAAEKPSSLKEALEAVEKHWLQQAHASCKTTYEMAKFLGISQPSVVRKLKKYGIE
ncbi:sigma 54-interacting transcriptional regulator [Bacillaceae bacterium]